MRYAILTAFVALSAGCVPVTTPVGDIDKAEPDKALVGAWTDSGADKVTLTIDVPAVKGNPKGLMRAVEEDPKKAIWFFTSKVGKHSYANVIIGDKELEFTQFTTEGGYEAWQKVPSKKFFVVKYTVDGDKVTFDGGSEKAVKKLMDAEKVGHPKGNDFFYETSAGWLEKYLAKNDPATIFDDSNTGKYQRPKKK